MKVPCLVDEHGVQPTTVAHYPKQLAALDRTPVSVQELGVESSLTEETDAVHHAVMVDPLTAAVCTLPRIGALVDEMLEARASAGCRGSGRREPSVRGVRRTPKHAPARRSAGGRASGLDAGGAAYAWW